MKRILSLSLLLISVSCKDVPCLNDEIPLTDFVVVNNGHTWNCGMEEWKANQEDLDGICILLNEMVDTKRAYVRTRYWRLDIYFNNTEEDFFRRELKLYNSEYDGLVFRNGDYFYKSDSLARYIIEKVGVQLSKPGPCDS
jgi:hypothetical protein